MPCPRASVARSLRPVWLLVAALLSGCGKDDQSAPPPSPPPAAAVELPATGQGLAAITCTLCHTLPSPGQLPPEEWPYLLAWMGVYVGYPPEIEINRNLIAPCFVPPEPRISRAQFDAIRRYYLEQSAVQYHLPPSRPKPPVAPWFEPVPVELPARVVCMVAIDPTNHALLMGSSRPSALYVMQQGALLSKSVPSEPVSFERLGPVQRFGLMGNFTIDNREGQILDLDTRDGHRDTPADNQPRVVDHCTADLDGDGLDDLVVCGFGDYPVGRVGIFWGGDDKRHEQILFEEPGAVWCGLSDLDGDGRKDIVIAIGSNRPRLLAFVNQGHRQFEQQTLVTRPVGWGYNRCLLTDWDGDGKQDIVEVCGNNIELRGRPLKPWHDFRVLHNDGHFQFHEVLFEPIPGAMDVAAGDFDGDGRIDLAVTAFCPDWRDEFPTTFLLLMRQPDGTVKRFGLEDRFWNRWMRIAAGDAQGDGRVDLLLGAAEVPVAVPAEHLARSQQLMQQKTSALLLRNRGAH